MGDELAVRSVREIGKREQWVEHVEQRERERECVLFLLARGT